MVLIYAKFNALVAFNLFQCIENRICTGIDGRDKCCVGFSLNRTTGECEKCSNGYFGSNCSSQCIYPTYGEDCQHFCKCLETKCHFSYGCIEKKGSFNQYKIPGSTKPILATFLPKLTTVLSSNKTFPYPVATEESSTYTHKLSDTTANSFPSYNNLLNNNIFVGLFGVFVVFFVLFGVTFIYLKFFRKKKKISKIKESDWQDSYQSLHLDTVGIQRTEYPESNERSNADTTYLTPLFNQNESGDTGDLQGQDVRQGFNEEQALGRQGFIHDSLNMYAENEVNVSPTNLADSVYDDIVEDYEESLNLTVDVGGEFNIVSSNEIETVLDGSIVYMNQ